jgi:hypothetical protein
MQKIPKLDKFIIPEGYFEQLPDQIMDSIHPTRDLDWVKYAAAVVLFLAAGIWDILPLEQQNVELTLDQEVELYIDSQYWTAEDVLSMAENPDELLEQIIEEEYPEGLFLWEDEQTWL